MSLTADAADAADVLLSSSGHPARGQNPGLNRPGNLRKGSKDGDALADRWTEARAGHCVNSLSRRRLLDATDGSVRWPPSDVDTDGPKTANLPGVHELALLPELLLL